MPKDTFNFNYNSIFIISKHLLKTSWLRITEVKLQMLSNCLDFTFFLKEKERNLPKDTFNFNYNSIFIISKHLLKTSWLRITEVKLQMLSNCLTLQSCNCVFRNLLLQKKSVKGNYPWKESSDSEITNKIGNTLWCSCGKYKSMATHAQSICYAALINMKFVKVISNVYLLIFFYSLNNW